MNLDNHTWMSLIRVILFDWQIDTASSLISLGTLIAGIPSAVIASIPATELLTASQSSVFVTNMLAAPQIVQETYVNKVPGVSDNVVLATVILFFIFLQFVGHWNMKKYAHCQNTIFALNSTAWWRAMLFVLTKWLSFHCDSLPDNHHQPKPQRVGCERTRCHGHTDPQGSPDLLPGACGRTGY